MTKSKATFKARPIASISALGVLIALSAAAPTSLRAQAGPGPIVPPQTTDTSSSPHTPPPAARPKPPQLPPRTTLAGPWKLNRDDSDDPRARVRAAEGSGNRNSGGNPGGGSYPGGGYPGGGYPGGGYPGGGYPGGGYPGGGYPGGGYPGGGGGRRNSGPDLEDNPKLQPLLRRSDSLTVDVKNPEVIVTDDEFHTLTLFTDGRQLPKQTDQDHLQVLAHWSGTQLVSDEKSPLVGNMSRTFELSSDGRELHETLHIDANKSKSPITIRLIYAVSTPDMQTGEDSDPDRPVLKRHSDDSGASPQ